MAALPNPEMVRAEVEAVPFTCKSPETYPAVEVALVTVRLVKESPVPCPWVKPKFCRVEEAVVEVAVSQPTVGEEEAKTAPVPLP